jgi:hypothetical protein
MWVPRKRRLATLGQPAGQAWRYGPAFLWHGRSGRVKIRPENHLDADPVTNLKKLPLPLALPLFRRHRAERLL